MLPNNKTIVANKAQNTVSLNQSMTFITLNNNNLMRKNFFLEL